MKKFYVMLESGTNFWIEGHSMLVAETGAIQIYSDQGDCIAIVPSSGCVYQAQPEKK